MKNKREWGRVLKFTLFSISAGAIEMVKIDGNMRPVVNEGACIGCGSCEYHCPVGTAGHLPSERAAIYVEGLSEHRLI